MKTGALISGFMFAGLALCAAEPATAERMTDEKAAVESTAQHDARAAGFFSSLSAQEGQAMGIGKLSAEQRDALETLASKELRLARQGDVRGFAGTFTSRRTEEERVAAGLARLTTAEKYQLDRLVARALAVQPAQAPVMITRASSDSVQLREVSPWETHGLVQLEYGFGSGDREYKAGTIAVTRENVRTGTALTFAYTVAEGDHWWSRGACWGCRYGRP
jgi:hypothetical protein